MKNSAKFSPKEEKRMKKYHFQENEKDFGSTVRLDAINDKVKEIKKKEETYELWDANEFLNVF